MGGREEGEVARVTSCVRYAVVDEALFVAFVPRGQVADLFETNCVDKIPSHTLHLRIMERPFSGCGGNGFGADGHGGASIRGSTLGGDEFAHDDLWKEMSARLDV